MAISERGDYSDPNFTPTDGANAVVAAAQAVYARAGLPYPSSFPQQRVPGGQADANDAGYTTADEEDVVEEQRQQEEEEEDSLRDDDDEDGLEEEEVVVREYYRTQARAMLDPPRSPRGIFFGVAEQVFSPAGSRRGESAPLTSPPASPSGSTASQGTLRGMLREARDALEEAHNEVLCQICYTNRRDALLMPCLHLLYCGVGPNLERVIIKKSTTRSSDVFVMSPFLSFQTSVVCLHVSTVLSSLSSSAAAYRLPVVYPVHIIIIIIMQTYNI